MDTNAVLESLAAKLDAADLTDAESELLRILIGDDDDVSGFAMGWSPLLGNAVAIKPLKPLGGDELWIVAKPLGGDDPGW